MKYFVIRDQKKKGPQYIGVAITLYLCYAYASGEIFKFQYFDSRLVYFSSQPNEYWEVLSIYAAICTWLFIYSIIGFPVLEKYFVQAQENRNTQLSSRTLKQQLLIYLVTPVVIIGLIFGLAFYAT
jgi:hypothetical protein